MLLLVPASLAMVAALIFVPGPLACCVSVADTTHGAFVPDQLVVSTALGGRFHRGETWANAVSVEAVRGNLRGEVTLEDFWRPRHIQYLSARLGHLWHPRQHAAGGVSIGYMHAHGDTRQSGPEIGLPLVFITDDGMSTRFEPTYVAAKSSLVFNYRFQLRVPVSRSRYFLGASIVGKGNPPPSSPAYQDEFTGTGFMLLWGSRF